MTKNAARIIIIKGAPAGGDDTSIGKAVCGALKGAALAVLASRKSPSSDGIRRYPQATELETIQADFPEAAYLIIQSDAIPESIQPDLLICLPDESQSENADLMYGGRVSCPDAKSLARRLGLASVEFCALIDAINVRLKMCDFGVF